MPASGPHRQPLPLPLPRPPAHSSAIACVGLHRVRELRRSETRALGGIPVTSPARLTLDLAGSLGEAALAHVLGELHVARLVSDRSLREVLAAHPRHPGAARLEAMLAFERGGQTRSEAERALARIIVAARLAQALAVA